MRRAILRERPRIVAVELPGSLEDVYLQTLARLPEMSVILYPDPKDDERAIYVPVEPCDPFTEAVRTALEIDAEVIFIEPDSGDRPHLPDTYPDPYSIRYIGLNKYIEAYRVYPAAPQRGNRGACGRHGVEAARRRSAGAGVCVVVSLNLLDPLLDAMEAPAGCAASAPRRPISGC